MRNRINNLFSVILALAMVVSTIAVPNTYTVKAEDGEYTSDQIKVVGFQIRCNEDDLAMAPHTAEDVAFRTVIKAPNIGDDITANGEKFKVSGYGTIYAKHPGIVGTDECNYLTTDTLLNLSSKAGTSIITYTGKSRQDGILGNTVGYVNTSKAIIDTWDPSDKSSTYYAITMQKMHNVMKIAFQIRPFIIATDASGNEVFIYSSSVETTSVVQVAYDMYTKGIAKNYDTHKYIYNHVLNCSCMRSYFASNPSFPYYPLEEYEFGWSGNLDPSDNEANYPGGGPTLDD